MADGLKKRFKRFFKKGHKVTYLEAAKALNTSREDVYTMSSCYLEFLEEGTGTMVDLITHLSGKEETIRW